MRIITKLKNLAVSLTIVAGITVMLSPLSFAQANYSCGAYGARSYSQNTCSDSQASGGGLSETGRDVLTYVLIALVCIGGASVILIFARRNRKKN
jgi:hypothetical protein